MLVFPLETRSSIIAQEGNVRQCYLMALTHLVFFLYVSEFFYQWELS